jgi:hypothetical protein
VDPSDDVDAGSRHGRSEVMLALRRARQSFSEYRHELHELFDGGDTVGHLPRDDQPPPRLENSRNPKDALKAAGLPD